jgi:hypothetical protein
MKGINWSLKYIKILSKWTKLAVDRSLTRHLQADTKSHTVVKNAKQITLCSRSSTFIMFKYQRKYHNPLIIIITLIITLIITNYP